MNYQSIECYSTSYWLDCWRALVWAGVLLLTDRKCFLVCPIPVIIIIRLSTRCVVVVPVWFSDPGSLTLCFLFCFALSEKMIAGEEAGVAVLARRCTELRDTAHFLALVHGAYSPLLTTVAGLEGPRTLTFYEAVGVEVCDPALLLLCGSLFFVVLFLPFFSCLSSFFLLFHFSFSLFALLKLQEFSNVCIV